MIEIDEKISYNSNIDIDIEEIFDKITNVQNILRIA